MANNTMTLSAWKRRQLFVECGMQQMLVDVSTNEDNMKVRKGQFTIPSDTFSTNFNEKKLEHDVSILNKNFIDEICIGYVQKNEYGKKEYVHEDYEEIPKGITIFIKG